MTPSSVPRIVLVTGAAKRLGREMALQLAQAGWRVAVHYRRSEKEAMEVVAACCERTAGSMAFCADLTQEAAVHQLMASIVKRMGGIDAVVNNASMFELDTAQDFSFEQMLQHMRGNVGAPVVLARELAKHVRTRAGQGVVVNLLDQKLWSVNPDFFSYSLSKAALQMATNMLAQALAPHVRVCAVAPGLSYPSYLQTDNDFERTSKLSLTADCSSPQDIAKAVVFMLETASVTGATLLVDGGQHLMGLNRDVSFL